MTDRFDDCSLRWAVRAIQPPGNTEALRRAIADRPGVVMLESVARDGPAGRYSIFGWEPVRVITVPGTGNVDPFSALTDVWRPWCRLEPVPKLPFVGGWIGTIAYEAGRFIEPRAYECPAVAHHQTGRQRRHPEPGLLPIAHWALFDTVLIHDAHEGCWFAAGVELPPRFDVGTRPSIAARLDAVERFVARSAEAASVHPDRQVASLQNHGRWNFSRSAYLAKVERTLQYIRAGDIFQANIARRCRIDVADSPVGIYQRLCEANPAAYAAYINIMGDTDTVVRCSSTGTEVEYDDGDGDGDDVAASRFCTTDLAAPCDVRRSFAVPRRPRGADATDAFGLPARSSLRPCCAVLSSSPELFLRLHGRDVVTRPIKGTRPRGRSRTADVAARQALARSEKDRAELNMIVDLLRNDLGRVCEFGTIRVAHDGELETHPTVFHRTATIIGRLQRDADAIDLIRATFPGGSITGAPKVRAMQIINELEPDPRGSYCGAIGYVGLDGDMQLNLAIRTMTVVENPDTRQSSVFLYVGSGIVADSVPEDEYAELHAKAAGMLAALGVTPSRSTVTRRPTAACETPCSVVAQPP